MGSRRNELIELSSHEQGANGHRTEYRVPPHLPLFHDHFPTHPVLPAFFIVDLALRQTRRRWVDLGPWIGMPKLKLLLPLGPKQQFTLELTRTGDRTSFSLVMRSDDGDRPAVHGEFRFGPRPSTL